MTATEGLGQADFVAKGSLAHLACFRDWRCGRRCGYCRRMDEFASACASVRDRVLASDTAKGIDAVWLDYVRDDGRLTEAANMTPCVTRMVTSELHPPRDGTPVGRLSRRVPPLGQLLADLGQHESAVRRLVMVTVAYGYFAMIDAEAIAAIAERPFPPIVAGRSAEQVWPYWVTNMSTAALLAQVTGKKEIGKVTNICGESLYQGLLDLGLVGRRRRKVPYMGRFYAQAGMLLRVVQSETLVPEAVSESMAITNRWPFEEMPTE